MSALELRDVTKRLGDHLAVDRLSLRVEEGEFFVLLGPSGCGKTTTLRLICGLDQPDSGEIILDGTDISTLPPRERNIGMVFQEYGLYPAMDVWGNIAYGLQARGKLDKSEIERRVAAASAKLGLTDMLRRSTQDLSGGEQQRVALARAMVKDASAYLYDEPLSNLDPKLRNHARRDIVAVHRDKQQASLYVTHDQSEAFAMADRVGVLADGRLQQVGTPDELLARPVNAFMARFVGSPSMNLLKGAIRVDDGHPRVVGSGVSITLPGPWLRALVAAGTEDVLVGIRPDALSPAGNGSDSIEGEIVDAEPGLTETIARIVTSGGVRITAVISEDVEFDVGQQVRLGVDTSQVHLFDAETEEVCHDDLRP